MGVAVLSKNTYARGVNLALPEVFPEILTHLNLSVEKTFLIANNSCVISNFAS